MRIRQSVGVILGLCVLTACTNSKPSCPVGSGLGCQSVMEVNTAINEGYGSDTQASSATSKPKKLTLAPISTYKGATPQRTQEQWVKVWVPAHIDDDNNYHPDTEYYTVIKAPEWRKKTVE